MYLYKNLQKALQERMICIDDLYLVSSKFLLSMVFIFRYPLSLNVRFFTLFFDWGLKSVEAFIKCMSLLHAKFMLIGYRVFYFSKKVTSFIITGLQQQGIPFDKDWCLLDCGLLLSFMILWLILGECFMHERISYIKY